MVADTAQVAVLHLGTNDALNAKSDRECLDNARLALKEIECTHLQTKPDVPLLVCAVPPTKKQYAVHRVQQLNNLFQEKCAQNNSLHFIDTKLQMADLWRDGIHLTEQGKDKLATAIIAAVQDLKKPPFHNGHQKIFLQRSISVVTTARHTAQHSLNPWL